MRESLNLTIYRDLYEKIKSRFYKPNQQLPTESELEKSYGVSKAPIRQALGKLEADGLIIRKAGKGTFVSPQIKKENASFLGGFGSHFSKYRKNLSYQTVEIKTVAPKERVIEKLQLQKGQPVALISRLRLMNNQPIFLLNHYVANFSADTFKKASTIENMREFLQNLGIDMTYITENIQAVSADKYLSEHFKLPLNAPLLKIYRTTFDKNYLPVVYEEYYVNSEEWTYDIQFNAENQTI